PDTSTAEDLVAKMDARAREILNKNNLLFAIWHRRFVEIAPVAVEVLKNTPNAATEIKGGIKIGNRNVLAYADRIWNGGVLDIKTGTAPSKNQIMDGNMPQLPLEALMLKNGGFTTYTSSVSDTPIMVFVQLKSHNVRIIKYDCDETAMAMQATYDKTLELFNMYSVGAAPYKYLRTSDSKYKAVDDFARVDERD
ncbi:MAG: hypothetical protein IKZ64_02065, partial [Alphaproteobacteria bacterium]|nr:hypothetical protein [Alphaproteobacteria bacterium]